MNLLARERTIGYLGKIMASRLLHSVPIDASGDYIEEEAEELGQKANSHGCIRLTVADAK